MNNMRASVLLVFLTASMAYAAGPATINDVGNLFTMDTKGAQVGDFYRMTWLAQSAPAGIYRQDQVDFSFTAPITTTVQGLRWMSAFQDENGGTTDPNFTISIKADNAGNPGTTLGTPWTGTFSHHGGIHNTPVGTVNLTADQVYHVSFKVNNITAPTMLDFSEVQIRITTADCFNPPIPDANVPFNPATFDYSDYQVRSYDGKIDTNMYAKYYDDLTGQWVTGASGHYYDVNTGQYQAARYEAYKIKQPLFGLYSDSNFANPIPEMTYGYNDYVTMSRNASSLMMRPDPDPNDPNYANYVDAAGESFVYNDAAPTINSLKLRMFRSGPGADKPITIQLRNATTNAVIATTIVDANSVRSGNIGTQPDDGWVTTLLHNPATYDPNDPNASVIDVDLARGQRYLIVALSEPNMTGGGAYYDLRTHGFDVAGATIGIGATSFLGTTDYLVTSSDGGSTWIADTNKDTAFAMGMWIKGDVNNDHIVNVQDLSLMGTNWKLTGRTWAQGDVTGDGIVNVSDLSILGTHWKEHLPEPATMALVALGGLFLSRRRR